MRADPPSQPNTTPPENSTAKMPSVTGSIKAVENGFVATFVVDGEDHAFSGTTQSSAPSFESSTATLTYGEADELSGTRKYHATLAGATILFKFENGPSIQGTLDVPGTEGITYNFSSTGSWSSN